MFIFSVLGSYWWLQIGKYYVEDIVTYLYHAEMLFCTAYTDHRERWVEGGMRGEEERERASLYN